MYERVNSFKVVQSRLTTSFSFKILLLIIANSFNSSQFVFPFISADTCVCQPREFFHAYSVVFCRYYWAEVVSLNVFDLVNQHDNGPRHDIVDNLCSVLAKIWFGFGKY